MALEMTEKSWCRAQRRGEAKEKMFFHCEHVPVENYPLSIAGRLSERRMIDDVIGINYG
jgi:hypothetical protein